MKKQKVYFVVFWAPGSFFGESWTSEVKTPDPMAVKWPDNAYSFTMHEREDVVDGDTRFRGDSIQVGPAYFHPDSKVETLTQVKKNPKSTPTLIENMRCNKWEAVVWSRWGNWPQPFEKGKAVVLPKTGGAK